MANTCCRLPTSFSINPLNFKLYSFVIRLVMIVNAVLVYGCYSAGLKAVIWERYTCWCYINGWCDYGLFNAPLRVA